MGVCARRHRSERCHLAQNDRSVRDRRNYTRDPARRSHFAFGAVSRVNHPPSVAVGPPLTLPLVLAACVGMLMLSMGIGRFAYTPILPDMLAAGALTLRSAGLVAGANFASYFIGAIVATAFATPIATRRLMLVALAVVVITAEAMALANSPATFMAVRFVAGFASGIAFVYGTAIGMDTLIRIGARRHALLIFVGIGSSISATGLLVVWLQAIGAHWRDMWWGMSVLAVPVFSVTAWGFDRMLLAVPARLAAAGTPAEAPQPAGSAWPFVALNLGYACFGMGYIIHATYLPTLVRSVPALEHWATWSWVVVGLAAAPSPWVWSYLSERLGVHRAIAISFVVEAIAALAPFAGLGVAGVAIAAIGLGGTFVGISSLIIARGRAITTMASSRSIGILTVVFGAGQILGPIFAGYLAADSGGFLWPSVAACGALLLGAWLSTRPQASAAASPIRTNTTTIRQEATS